MEQDALRTKLIREILTDPLFTDRVLHRYFKWIDKTLAPFVKDHFAPNKSWVGKPFTREDAMFFMTSLRDLSRTFTTGRERTLPRYFEQKKYRSSYMLFFLPLHASKFISVLLSGHEPMESLLFDWTRGEKIVLGDFGSGPLTASIALHFYLSEFEKEFRQKFSEPFPLGELEWNLVDLDKTVIEDGLALVRASFKEEIILKRSKYIVRRENWGAALTDRKAYHLSMFGNVLNEAPQFREAHERALLTGFPYHERTLFVEPATENNSHRLIQVRQRMLEEFKGDVRIFGPCLHYELCPLRSGRDWCHFSIPLEIESKWYKFFTYGLHHTHFEWVKMSYLWLGNAKFKSTRNLELAKEHTLVVSDPIFENESRKESFVLLCEPERARKYRLGPGQKLHRGDVITKISIDPKSKNSTKPKSTRPA